MNRFNVIENKLTNLIPVINPGLQQEYGIKAAILYRVCPTIEVDSSEIVKDAYKKMYGECIPECADTIFNAFIPFLDFCRAKLILLKYQLPKDQKELLLLFYIHLDEIFDGYSDLRKLFDRFFDLMYSFSNLMPAPKNFNGSKDKRGKGTWKLNNDYPSLYYENLKDCNSGIYNREEMKIWLDSVMDEYKIKEMYKLQPPYSINEYYGYNDEKLQQLVSYIKNAIRLIEDRFSVESKDKNFNSI